MRRTFLPVLLILILLILPGCSNEPDERINMPSSSRNYKGANYQEVIAELQEAGFSNIETVVLDDLVMGWLTKDGEVEEVEVDGRTSFSTDTKFSSDVKIVVSYHTFPEGTPTESEEPKTSEPPTEVSEEPGAPEDVILTIENCEDLIAVLSSNGEINSLYAEFAENYKGQFIEFDGYIYYIAQNSKYETRWDILLQAGDYIDEDTINPGPIFKFENVHPFDMGIKDLDLPSFMFTGKNVRIVAKVVSYDDNAGIFELNPELVEAR